jgi:flagellar basal body L-ring protein FlgH
LVAVSNQKYLIELIFMELRMKIFIYIILLAAFSGCSMTAEQKQALASGMQSAGQAMNQEVQLMKQRMHEQSLQSSQQNIYQTPRQTNCITTYSQLFKAYETTCN